MTASPNIVSEDLQRWLSAIRTLEGILRMNLAERTCYLAIDYWVIHQYAFPSHRDILSEKEDIKEKLYQNHIRCDWILNWLPLEWKQPLMLPPPYKEELASQLNHMIGPRDLVNLDEPVISEAISQFIREFDQNTAEGDLPDRIDSETLGKLYDSSKILFLAVTLGTRQGFKKVRDLISPPDDCLPSLQIDPESGPQQAIWRAVLEHQAAIEKNAGSLWEPILRKQPRRSTKYASNRRDSVALESVRFINSLLNPDGSALILISGAPSLLGTLSEVPADQCEVAMTVSPEAQETLRFPFGVSPEFFSFYLSHSTTEDGTRLKAGDILVRLVTSRRGLEAILDLVKGKTVAKTDRRHDVFAVLNKALANTSSDRLTHKTLCQHIQFLKSFVDMNRATVLFSSGIDERVPEPVRARFARAVRHLDFAREEIQRRYKLLLEAAKKADLESILAEILAAVSLHGQESHELSGLCSFVEKTPQSLNYGFLYKETPVEDYARTIFRVLRTGLFSSRSRHQLPDALLEIRSMAQKGNALAKLLLAHVKTKLGDLSQDEGALRDLEEGKKLLKTGQKHLEAHFDFVKNIADYHLGRLDTAVSRSDRLARESDRKTPRFHLQAGFLRWCRYEQDPSAGSDDLDKAIELALSAEQLSKGDPETHALTLANLARAYVERGRLDEEKGDPSPKMWEKAATLIETSLKECSECFGETKNWPACIVFAAAFVNYECLLRTYDASAISPENARQAYDILKGKLSNLLPVLDDNKRWQRPKVASDYAALMKKISRYLRQLEDRAQGMPSKLGHPGQATGPAADNTGYLSGSAGGPNKV